MKQKLKLQLLNQVIKINEPANRKLAETAGRTGKINCNRTIHLLFIDIYTHKLANFTGSTQLPQRGSKTLE